MATNSDFKPLDALAASYLTADIAAARAEIKNLDQQIEKLQANRRALEFKVTALMQATPAEIPGPEASAQPSGASGPVDDLGMTPKLSFRDMICQVLQNSRQGLKPKDVAQKLLDAGVAYTASTDISVRVGNDLYRLEKSGTVKKKGGLYYYNREALA